MSQSKLEQKLDEIETNGIESVGQIDGLVKALRKAVEQRNVLANDAFSEDDESYVNEEIGHLNNQILTILESK